MAIPRRPERALAAESTNLAPPSSTDPTAAPALSREEPNVPEVAASMVASARFAPASPTSSAKSSAPAVSLRDVLLLTLSLATWAATSFPMSMAESVSELAITSIMMLAFITVFSKVIEMGDSITTLLLLDTSSLVFVSTCVIVVSISSVRVSTIWLITCFVLSLRALNPVFCSSAFDAAAVTMSVKSCFILLAACCLFSVLISIKVVVETVSSEFLMFKTPMPARTSFGCMDEKAPTHPAI